MIIKEGIVVYIICFICLNKSTPVNPEAIFVVSDKGDILSPKYAPDMIAPQIIPTGRPIAVPILNRARPTVAIVLHELPVDTDIIAVIIAVAKRNISVARLIQIPDNKLKTASIVIITHKTKQLNSDNCLKSLKKNKKILKRPVLLRLFN